MLVRRCKYARRDTISGQSNPQNLFCFSVVVPELQVFPKHIKWPEWWWPGGGLGDTIAHSIVDLLCKNSNFYVFWLMRQPSNPINVIVVV